MSKLTYQHIKGDKRYSNAISLCLYKSDKFVFSKHIQPMDSFLIEGGQLNYDILIFYQDESIITQTMLEHPHVRLFQVTSDEKHFDRHLWRYMGAEEQYEWTWFRGVDTPKIPSREIKLQNIAQHCVADIVIWSAPYSSCMGKFCMNKQVGKQLINYLRETHISHELKQNWNVDELILSNWVDSGNQKVLYVIDRPTYETPHKEQWIINRLRTGNHITIVKDRDDRQSTTR